MDTLTLLRSAEAAGLTVEVEGDTLRVRGPKSAEPVVREIMANKAAVLAELEKDAAPKAPDWPPDTADLIGWFFAEGQHHLPPAPFRLCPWITVTDSPGFKESLLFQISLGPDFLTNKNGKLQEDLRMLKAKISPDHTGE